MLFRSPIPVVDQAMFNFLIRQSPIVDTTLLSTNITGWAIQLGTTRRAVESGAGDLGKNGDLAYYDRVYKDLQPKFDGSSVKTPSGADYCIVHQWDRVPEIKEWVEKTYV